MATFFKLNPAKSLHNLLCLQTRDTKDGFIGIIVCPNFLANSYPSPEEPVLE